MHSAGGHAAARRPAGGLWRTAGEPAPKTAENPFRDVAETAYYYQAVLWAAESGVTNGVDKTHFSPDAPCLRCQVVTFLYRAVQNR